LPSSESIAVFSSGHPPGTSPARRSRNFLRSFETRVHRGLPGVLERFSRKLLLAFKVPVDSAFFQSCRSHEIGEGGAVIPFLIEDWSGLTNDFPPGLFAFTHVGTPGEADSATI
jgi:hypothetical protein